jgi:hypothetical protein
MHYSERRHLPIAVEDIIDDMPCGYEQSVAADVETRAD